jgi:hypothetical protein
VVGGVAFEVGFVVGGVAFEAACITKQPGVQSHFASSYLLAMTEAQTDLISCTSVLHRSNPLEVGKTCFEEPLVAMAILLSRTFVIDNAF